MYWGPLHEINANEASGLITPTIENTKDQLSITHMQLALSNNIMKIINKEFDKYLENDENWSELNKKLRKMSEHLVCAEVDDYVDVERNDFLKKYFIEWGFVHDDDMWELYKHYIPKYECRVVPPSVTGARSATEYSQALIEQDLIPYEAAFLYFQIFFLNQPFLKFFVNIPIFN